MVRSKDDVALRRPYSRHLARTWAVRALIVPLSRQSIYAAMSASRPLVMVAMMVARSEAESLMRRRGHLRIALAERRADRPDSVKIVASQEARPGAMFNNGLFLAHY